MTSRGIRRPLLVVSTVLSIGLCGPPFDQRSDAQIPAQEPAAMVSYPRIEVWGLRQVDTQITLGNASDDPATAYCQYLNATGECAATGAPCLNDSFDSFCVTEANPGDTCLPRRSLADFTVTVQPQSVLGWNAKDGLPSTLPTQIPPVATDPFIGELRCLVVSADDEPLPRDVLIGNATVYSADSTGQPPAGYSAIGVRSTGVNDGNRVLCLGADAQGQCPVAEYVPCPRVLQFTHFYGAAFLPPDRPVDVLTTLTLVSCSRPADLFNPTPVQLQVATYNEFGQQTGVGGVTMTGWFADLVLERVSPAFTVGVQGTLGGQTRLRAVLGPTGPGGGLLGVVNELYRVEGQPPPIRHGMAGHGVAGIGAGPEADVFTLPPVPSAP